MTFYKTLLTNFLLNRSQTIWL